MMRNAETAKMLMSFFNAQAGTSFRIGDNQRKVDIILDALDRANDVTPISELKQYIREYVAKTPADQRKPMACFESFVGSKVQTPAPATEAPTENQVTNSLGILEQALMEVIRKQSIPEIEKTMKEDCTKMLEKFIEEKYGVIERKIITVIDGKDKELPKGEILHEKFDKVLQYVANNEPVYLVGPAGSGKNVICKQVADALNLKFYYTNSVTQEYKLTGFTDANGNYQPTPFYEAFTKGGLFMLDEMDASIPDTLITLNAAIANRYFTFPAPIGQVKAHPDFRIVAAGNTIGHGADNEYVGRTQLDFSTLTRFGKLTIDYCADIENKVANGDIELADFCREFRKAAKKTGMQVIVSYREIGRLAKFMQLFELSEALDSCLLKGALGKDDLNVICNELKESKFKTALRTLIAQS